MIISTVKFVLYTSLANKKVCGGSYLLDRKHQVYHAEKTINLPPIYFVVKPFDLALINQIAKAHSSYRSAPTRLTIALKFPGGPASISLVTPRCLSAPWFSDV
jgi:hypothetical protein